MSRRQSKIDVGTIGSRACEISLNKILIKLDDAYLTRRVMSRYNRFRDQINKIKHYDDKDFRRFLLRLLRKHHFDQLEETREFFPKDAYTHLLCCMTAEYRTAIKK
jgi:hypothetical protein